VITVHDQYWPLLVHVLEGATSLTQLEIWLTKLEGYLARKQKTMTLCVARDLKIWEPALLRRSADWMREHRESMRANSLGFAFVLPSPVARGMLKALLFMQPLPQGHHVSSTVADALIWIRGVAEKNGAPLPPLTGIEKSFS
jgi:hypothetical protein